MITVQEAIIVEGKYDKIKLSSFLDAVILETRGFRIFKDKAQLALLRKLAQTRGLLVFTDSDSAGFLIRNYLKGAIAQDQIKHAYLPDIFGKEARKSAPSKEGKLGVEGVQKELLLKALRTAGATLLSDPPQTKASARRLITKQDLFALGLTGAGNSAQKRKDLLKALDLPEHLTTNALLPVLNSLFSYKEFCEIVRRT